MKKNIVAFIPARGGSKSIPKKNIITFCGKPLVYWVIEAAVANAKINNVYVSTDDGLIRETVEGFSLPKVKVIERSACTATDEAKTESALLEFAEKIKFDYVVLIQPTSPLLEVHDLEKGLEIYFNESADSLISGVRKKSFIWQFGDKYGSPLNYDPQNRPRRQEWAGYFVENGAFYITSKQALLESKCRVSGNVLLYEMPGETYYEIDEVDDWAIMEKLKERKLYNE